MNITLDGSPIFSGELRQAPGNVAEALQRAEAVLFTDSPPALERIELHDAKYAAALEAGSRASPPLLPQRGGSGGSEGGGSGKGSWGRAGPPAEELDLVTSAPSPRSLRPGQPAAAAPPALLRTVTGGRPLTAANVAAALAAAAAQEERSRSGDGASTSAPGGSPAPPPLRSRQLLLVVLESHGDSHFVGLSGLEVVGADSAPLLLAPASVFADPPDLNVFPGHTGAVALQAALLQHRVAEQPHLHCTSPPPSWAVFSPSIAVCVMRESSVAEPRLHSTWIAQGM